MSFLSNSHWTHQWHGAVMSLCGSGKTPPWLRPWPCHKAQREPFAGRRKRFSITLDHICLVEQWRKQLYSQLCAPRPAGSAELVSNKPSEKKKRLLLLFSFIDKHLESLMNGSHSFFTVINVDRNGFKKSVPNRETVKCLLLKHIRSRTVWHRSRPRPSAPIFTIDRKQTSIQLCSFTSVGLTD